MLYVITVEHIDHYKLWRLDESYLKFFTQLYIVFNGFAVDKCYKMTTGNVITTVCNFHLWKLD